MRKVLRFLRGRGLPYLIGLCLFGVWLAVTVPGFLAARNRSMQKRSMADMRAIAQAIEARATDANMYALSSGDAPFGGEPGDLTKLRRVSYEQLRSALSPKYLKDVPRYDGWGREFEFFLGATSYSIRSAGSDGRAEGDRYVARSVNTFESDLVFSEGSFVQGPEGVSTQ